LALRCAILYHPLPYCPQNKHKTATKHNKKGALSPADVLAPVLRELAGLRAALLAPGGVGFRLFSASALIVYEGAATRAEDARPRVVLVDFAHAFPTSDRGAAGGTGGENNDETNAPLAGPDANTAAGVEGLMAAIESALRGGST
jgi:hypothetical protein